MSIRNLEKIFRPAESPLSERVNAREVWERPFNAT
jgi:hypothetical protein